MSRCDPSTACIWREDTRETPVFLARCQVIAIFRLRPTKIHQNFLSSLREDVTSRFLFNSVVLQERNNKTWRILRRGFDRGGAAEDRPRWPVQSLRSQSGASPQAPTRAGQQTRSVRHREARRRFPCRFTLASWSGSTRSAEATASSKSPGERGWEVGEFSTVCPEPESEGPYPVHVNPVSAMNPTKIIRRLLQMRDAWSWTIQIARRD